MRQCWRSSSDAFSRCRKGSEGARQDRLEHRRARLLERRAAEKSLAAGRNVGGERSPGRRAEPLALRLDRVLIAQRTIREERSVELREIRMPGEDVAFGRRRVGIEDFDATGDLLL